MKALNKYQVETAEKLLKDKLNEKIRALTQKAYLADIAKFMPLIAEYNKQAQKLVDVARDIKAKVEKSNKKLEVDLDSYDSIVKKLNKIDEEDNSLITARNRNGYGDSRTYADYAPDFSKEEEEVDQFILALKLGTATMDDLKPLLAKIEKIK